MTAEIGRVGVGWFALHLRDVRVLSRDGDWLRANLGRVDVEVGALLGLRRAKVAGGEIALKGSIDDIRQRTRSGRTDSNAPKNAHSGPEIFIEKLNVRWEGAGDPGAVLEIDGAHAARTYASDAKSERGERGDVGADAIRWSRPGVRFDARALLGRFAPASTGSGSARTEWQELVAGPVHVGVSLDALGEGANALSPTDESGPAAGAASAGSGPSTLGSRQAPAPLFASAALAKAEPGGAAIGSGTPQTVASNPRPRGQHLRDKAIEAAAWAVEHIAQQARVELTGLNLQVAQADQKLNLGPGTLRLEPRANSLDVDLAPGGVEQGSSPLRLHAEIPTRAGEISWRVEGGPVTLASLGVRENDFGLMDVGRATVAARGKITLSTDARTLAFDVDGRTLSLSIVHRKLAADPVLGLDVAFRGKGTLNLDGSLARVDDAEVDLGAIRVVGAGFIERGTDYVRLDGTIGIPTSDCHRMFGSIPSALVPKLHGLKMAGTFALKSALKLDTSRPEDIVLDWALANRCRILSAPAEIHVNRFRRPFQHTVYDEHNHKVQILAGPGTAEWVPLRAISPFMEASVTTTEDGGFRHHGGFDKTAITNSIRDDLRTGKFLRGASTITMQTVKNLYLDRDKSLSRKLQEAILTIYLEQEMTKDEILELYFNIVELGPMIYGVGPAAQFYFQTTPYELSLGQALFLSSILPAPKRTYFATDGQLSKGWSGYLRRVMKIMRDRKRITDQELTEGLTETLLLHSPKPTHSRKPGEIDGKGGFWLPPDAAP